MDSHRPVPQLWYSYLKLNTVLCFAIGLRIVEPPWFADKSRVYRYTWHLYQVATELVSYVVTLANLVGTVMLTEIFAVLASIPPLIHGINISGRALVLRSKRKVIENYIENLNAVLLENRRNPIEPGLSFSTLHAADFDYLNRYSKAETWLLILSNAMFFFPELVSMVLYPDDAKTIMVSWFPYDVTVSPNIEITNVIHTISWFIMNIKIAACDTIFFSLVILHTAQFKHLKYLLEKIFKDEALGSVDTLSPEESQQLEMKLRWWIKQHQQTISVSMQLKALYSPLLFYSYIESLVNMCLCAFLATEESPWTPLQRFSAVFIVGAVFVQLFFMCRAGDEMRKQSALVIKDAFATKVFRSSRAVQEHVLLILQRGNFPIRISAFGLFQLTSQHYGTLVRGVFSYYMALRQFSDRDSPK